MKAGVLVVDDDADIRETIGMLLARHGFPVSTACDGADALAQLRAGAHPGLILLDLMMPRMSGWEFRRRQMADERFSAVPVVVMTATTSRDEAAIQADDILRKPLSLSSLVSTIERHLSRVAAKAREAPSS